MSESRPGPEKAPGLCRALKVATPELGTCRDAHNVRRRLTRVLRSRIGNLRQFRPCHRLGFAALRHREHSASENVLAGDCTPRTFRTQHESDSARISDSDDRLERDSDSAREPGPGQGGSSLSARPGGVTGWQLTARPARGHRQARPVDQLVTAPVGGTRRVGSRRPGRGLPGPGVAQPGRGHGDPPVR